MNSPSVPVHLVWGLTREHIVSSERGIIAANWHWSTTKFNIYSGASIRPHWPDAHNRPGPQKLRFRLENQCFRRASGLRPILMQPAAQASHRPVQSVNAQFPASEECCAQPGCPAQEGLAQRISPWLATSLRPGTQSGAVFFEGVGQRN